MDASYIKAPLLTRFFKRAFDIISSALALLFLSPVFLIIAVLIRADSPGSSFFRQKRVGRLGKIFRIYKFRSMTACNDKTQIRITSKNDARITRVGAFIRKYKIDELPQLINVFLGNMSIVGPRPEVPEYVAIYTGEQRKVLSVRPGLTDPASITFIDEEQVLASSELPEKTYIEEILPKKLDLGIKYIEKLSFFGDLKLIFKTFLSILKK